MVINKIILEKDLTMLSQAEVLKIKYKGENLISRLESLGYNVLKTESNTKTFHEINNGIDIDISKKSLYKVLGYEIEDGSYINIDNVCDDEPIKFKNDHTSFLQSRRISKELVAKYKSKNLVEFATIYDTDRYEEAEVPSNKKVQVRFKNSNCYVNIPVIVCMPKVQYKAKYFSDKEYLDIINKMLIDDETLVDSKDILKSIRSIIDREVI